MSHTCLTSPNVHQVYETDVRWWSSGFPCLKAEQTVEGHTPTVHAALFSTNKVHCIAFSSVQKTSSAKRIPLRSHVKVLIYLMVDLELYLPQRNHMLSKKFIPPGSGEQSRTGGCMYLYLNLPGSQSTFCGSHWDQKQVRVQESLWWNVQFQDENFLPKKVWVSVADSNTVSRGNEWRKATVCQLMHPSTESLTFNHTNSIIVHLIVVSTVEL